jgi:hypothetical protein
MRNQFRAYIAIAFFALTIVSCSKKNEVAFETRASINLAGEWTVALDSADVGMEQHWFDSLFAQRITLPSTLDAAGLGTPNTLEPRLEKPQILHLTRKFSYVGAAWYVREFEVPKEWEGKDLLLNLERVLWTSDVWIDGQNRGHANSLSAPHRYAISGLQAGKHRLAIRIDNRKQFDISVRDMAHAYTNETQVMWNGILGDITLERADRVQICSVQVYPNLAEKGVSVAVQVLNQTGQPISGTINLAAVLKDKKLKPQIEAFSINSERETFEFFYMLGDAMQLWNEFSPNLYSMHVELKTENQTDRASTTFGMREISNRDGFIQINGTRVFMRGTLECSIFPLTGNPPLDEAGWQKVFEAAQQWGLNHLRFHSWCPPKAAFNVADQLGFYLQVELPLWSLTVGKDSATTRFLEDETQRILAEYGNHPSFCLWSTGNELEGDAALLNSWVTSLKAQDPRRLYMTTSFSFQKGLGAEPQPADDYFVTQWTNNGWIRGQGVFNSEPPAFNKNFSAPLKGIAVPVISHEIGQYSVYPNIKEIEKYKGSLIPLNFMAVKDDLQKRNLLHKADDFLMASGKLAAILYKEEIERAMKTPEFSGFQLLDLHDFPGQGTALVGLLDAFWESKGLIDAAEFRNFCGPVVPLLSFPKAVYLNSETFVATAGIANFTEKALDDKRLLWSAVDQSGKTLANGHFKVNALNIGYQSNLGEISLPLQDVQTAQIMTLKLSIDGTSYQNNWDIWVYPSNLAIHSGEVLVTQDIQQAKKALGEGRKVLFNPNWREVNGIEGKFVPVFWSPVHFPKQAGTMGVLCDPSHPALANFPTEAHSNWQWWDLNINSTAMVLDSISVVTPLIELVDNFVSNRRLASVFEARVGKGTLVFSSIDVSTDLDKRPVAKQLLFSLLNYMNSASFAPQYELKAEELNRMLTTQSISNSKKKSDAIY